MHDYQPVILEEILQKEWQEDSSMQAMESIDREKFYCLSMMPYPSGSLHMGHVRNYTIGDVIARYQRMLGKNVLQPISWDAFGLPAENAALQNAIPPQQWIKKNIQQMRLQLKRLGFSYDWSREFSTSDPNHYRWEQYLFLKMYKKGLAYQKNSVVNWDPVDQTVLANEQVIDGRGWRSGALVERREIPQWFLKITAYTDELLTGLDHLPSWPAQVIAMQKNWIGRSRGVEIQFAIADYPKMTLPIFTTRVDTLMGVTFLCIAAEHPLAKQAAQQQTEVAQFIEELSHIRTAEADTATLDKRGLPINFYALHPINGQRLPIWVTNYVLMDYATGAVMAVPAHDDRDFEFAQQHQLPIQQVIQINDQPWDKKKAITELGTLINSHLFDGLDSKEAQKTITQHLIQYEQATYKTYDNLHDWSIARQRYWGTPIPIIHCPSCGIVPVPEEDLPVVLPNNLVPKKGQASPLKECAAFYEVACPLCQEPARRETDTFDTFFESSWYYTRLACPDQDQAILDDRAKYWVPVDQYIGGIEHATMHLLYARFIHKVLRDENFMNSDEPFIHLLTQGMVLKDGSKMSKSKGNVVSPKALIDQYGADTVRLFIIFAAPPEHSLEWSEHGVEGAHRFLKRLWSLVHNWQVQLQKLVAKDNEDAEEAMHQGNQAIRHQIHSILKQANNDMARLKLNTVVSAAMKLFNQLHKLPIDSYHTHSFKEGAEILLCILAPITPHITHHLWFLLGHSEPIAHTPWPKIDVGVLELEIVTWVVQVNGKRRAEMTLLNDAEKEEIICAAKELKQLKRYLPKGDTPKCIIVPKKLINFVL